MRFSNVVFAAFVSVGLCSDYQESLNAILNNQIDPNDGSTGEVSFNTTGYGLEDYGIDAIENYTLKTYSSYNFLKTVSELADVAFSKGFHGDVVMLYYKFLYAGQHNSTSLDSKSDMLADIAKLIQSNPNDKRDSASFLELLVSSSSNDVVKNAFENASAANVNKIEKRWSDVVCHDDNKANVMDCLRLINTVKNDNGWNNAESTSLHFQDCFISWSTKDRFQYRDLYSGALACFEACSHDGVSCRAHDVYLSNMKLNQCLSNRGDGC